jgi:flagellar biosynthesis/type III secretory pathway chaperone
MESPNDTRTPQPSDYMSAATRLNDTIDQLTRVLDDEVEGVYTRKTDELSKLYHTKSRLLADYTSNVGHLRDLSKTDDRTELPAELRASLREKSARLAQAMMRNTKALRVAHEASQQVVNVIIDAVKRQRQSVPIYGTDHRGNMIAPTSLGDSATAVTLDTRL